MQSVRKLNAAEMRIIAFRKQSQDRRGKDSRGDDQSRPVSSCIDDGYRTCRWMGVPSCKAVWGTGF